jgi:hypothetical protein
MKKSDIIALAAIVISAILIFLVEKL